MQILRHSNIFRDGGDWPLHPASPSLYQTLPDGSLPEPWLLQLRGLWQAAQMACRLALDLAGPECRVPLPMAVAHLLRSVRGLTPLVARLSGPLARLRAERGLPAVEYMGRRSAEAPSLLLDVPRHVLLEVWKTVEPAGAWTHTDTWGNPLPLDLTRFPLALLRSLETAEAAARVHFREVGPPADPGPLLVAAQQDFWLLAGQTLPEGTTSRVMVAAHLKDNRLAVGLRPVGLTLAPRRSGGAESPPPVEPATQSAETDGRAGSREFRLQGHHFRDLVPSSEMPLLECLWGRGNLREVSVGAVCRAVYGEDDPTKYDALEQHKKRLKDKLDRQSGGLVNIVGTLKTGHYQLLVFAPSDRDKRVQKLGQN